MDSSAIYGFSIPIIILGALAAIAALIQVLRTRQHYARYTFIYLAGIFSFIRRVTYIAAINDDTRDLESSINMIKGNMARTFLYQMFVPFLYCVFFASCQSIITTMTTMPTEKKTTTTTTKLYYASKMASTILAYVWTFVLIVVNIAYCAVFANNFPIFSSDLTQQLLDMSRFTTYGIWAYPAFVILQLVFGWNQLRLYLVSLSLYLGTVLIATIGMTVSVAYSSSVSTDDDEFSRQTISFVLVELVGLLGLFCALFASIQYWQNVSSSSSAAASSSSPSSLAKNSHQQQSMIDDLYAPGDSKLDRINVTHKMHHLEDAS